MVNVAIDQKDLMFEGVKKSVTEMQMVKFGAYVDYNTKGYVTLRNVPIFWDQTPEYFAGAEYITSTFFSLSTGVLYKS